MLIDDIPFHKSLGTCGNHVFLAQGFKHRAACYAQESSPTNVGKGQDRQEHVAQRIQKNVKAAVKQRVDCQQRGVMMELV